MQLLCPYISHHTHQRASLPDTGPPASETWLEREGRKLSPLHELARKGTDLLHVQRWFKFTDHV